MYSVKGKLSRASFKGMSSFFSSSDFVMHYYVDIFSVPPKSLRNWQVYSYFVMCLFCIHRVIYLTDLNAGFIKTKKKAIIYK